METSALEIGRTYFQLTFADTDLTMPGVEPLVYIGRVELEEGGEAYVFQDSVSYVRFGSRLELKADHEEIMVCLLPARDVSGLMDVHGISNAVAEAADRASALKYPRLPVLKDGSVSVLPNTSLERTRGR